MHRRHRHGRSATTAVAFTVASLSGVFAAAATAGAVQALVRVTSAIAFATLLAVIVAIAVGASIRWLALRRPAPAPAVAGVVASGAIGALSATSGPAVPALVAALVVVGAGLGGLWAARPRATAAPSSGRSVAAWRDETGVGAAEYIGVILIVAAMVGAIAPTPLGDRIGAGIREALCRVSGVACGDGATAARGPEEPCVARHVSSAGRADISAVVDVGRELGYDTRYLSDGSVQVVYNDGGEVGIGVGAGLHAEVSWGQDSYEAGAVAEASARLAVTEGQVWQFTGPGADARAADWIRWHAVDTGVADAVIPGGRDGAVGKVYGLGHRMLNEAANWVGLGDDHPPTPPTIARFYEGGFVAGANARAGMVGPVTGAAAEVAAASERALGYRQNDDGTTVVYLAVSTSVAAEGAADDPIASAGGQASWAADGVMAVTLDRDHQPVRAQLTAYRIDEAGLRLDGVTAPAAALGDGLFAAGALDGEPAPPSVYQVDVALDLADPEQAALFDDFLVTGGSTLALGSPIAAPDGIVAAFVEGGQTTMVEYTSSESAYGGTLVLEAIGKAGGGVNVSQSEMNITNAYFYDREAGGYARWTACTS